MFPAILATSFIIYFAMNMTGGDPALTIAPENATEAQLDQIRMELGLKDPLIVRYGKYMLGICKGDLGKSYVTKKDVFKTYMERLPNTLQLAFSAVLIATLLAVPLGIYTAIHQNTWKDTGGMVFALFGVSMPNFWLALMLILLFSVRLQWFPSGGKGGLNTLVLPAVTVGLGFAALITRTTRSAMLDVIRQDYMTTARAKGAGEKKRHLSARLTQRTHPDHHGYRYAAFKCAHRFRSRGNGIFMAGYRPLDRRFHFQTRHADGYRRNHHVVRTHGRCKPRHRSYLRFFRSAHQSSVR